MNTLMKLLPLSAVLCLAACAGGGMGEPTTPVAIPTLPELGADRPAVHADNARVQTLSTGKSGHALMLLQNPTAYGKDKGELVYRAADGKTYRFSNFTNPMVPEYSSPDWRFPTKQAGQELAGGGKLFACCTGTGQFASAPATRLDAVRFGAWLSPQGEADLFVGGKTAEAAYLPGGSHELAGKIKGKATYEVLAVRVRNGSFVNSAYTPRSGIGLSKGEEQRSLITANFNTNKMGGTIIGNSDFGPDVVLDNLDIVGNSFGGRAESGGRQGTVSGRFFGEPKTSWSGEITGAATEEIGGKIVFDGDQSLNTVFGGKRVGEQTDDLSKDLNHLR